MLNVWYMVYCCLLIWRGLVCEGYNTSTMPVFFWLKIYRGQTLRVIAKKSCGYVANELYVYV